MHSLPGLEFNHVGKQYVCLLPSQWGISMLQKNMEQK